MNDLFYSITLGVNCHGHFKGKYITQPNVNTKIVKMTWSQFNKEAMAWKCSPNKPAAYNQQTSCIQSVEMITKQQAFIKICLQQPHSLDRKTKQNFAWWPLHCISVCPISSGNCAISMFRWCSVSNLHFWITTNINHTEKESMYVSLLIS